jgi:hypothetical protein
MSVVTEMLLCGDRHVLAAVLHPCYDGHRGPSQHAMSVSVHVVNCSVGMVTAVSGDACQPCETGYYSSDPRNSTCDQCVPGAQCPGGAVVSPVPGWWASSPRSVQMHR